MNDRSSTQSVATLVGAVFLLVGILGFIPGVTTHYGSLSFAGHDSHAKLLGVFQTSVLQNLIHLLFGVVGLALARVPDQARTYLVGGGAVYLVLWVVGLPGPARWLPTNTAHNSLHLPLVVSLIRLSPPLRT